MRLYTTRLYTILVVPYCRGGEGSRLRHRETARTSVLVRNWGLRTRSCSGYIYPFFYEELKRASKNIIWNFTPVDRDLTSEATGALFPTLQFGKGVGLDKNTLTNSNIWKVELVRVVAHLCSGLCSCCPPINFSRCPFTILAGRQRLGRQFQAGNKLGK